MLKEFTNLCKKNVCFLFSKKYHENMAEYASGNNPYAHSYYSESDIHLKHKNINHIVEVY